MIYHNILIIINFLFFFVLRNENRKKKSQQQQTNKQKNKRRMAALVHNKMACKLYTQISDCLMRKILLYFFTCCAKPVMQNSTFLFIVLFHPHVSVKAVLKLLQISQEYNYIPQALFK